MCGMAREFGDPIPLVAEMLEAGDRSGMPVDPRLWLAAPPRSSHPACLAVKAAAEQGDPAPYLRRLREGLMCRRRKLDSTDALIEEARAVPGLDLDKLRLAFGSHAIVEAFGADLDRAGAVPAEHHAPGHRPGQAALARVPRSGRGRARRVRPLRLRVAGGGGDRRGRDAGAGRRGPAVG